VAFPRTKKQRSKQRWRQLRIKKTSSWTLTMKMAAKRAVARDREIIVRNRKRNSRIRGQ
jgi:hypothetical protein